MPNTGNEPHRLAALEASWRQELAAWAIPEHITAAVTDSPWVLPRQVFARRADRLAADPGGPSHRHAWAALDPHGSVLDVGSGAGAASLPLLPRCTTLTAVDAEPDMLELLRRRVTAASGGADPTPRPQPGLRPEGVTAASGGADPRPAPELNLITGTWPDVAAAAATADVVTCHHVVYNAPDIGPFLAALTGAARRLVVVEMTARHPLVSLNELWLKFHGLVRPAGPTADDLLAILAAMGIDTGHERWRRPGGRDYASFAEMTDVTRRRLCLPPERASDVAAALVESGIDPDRPVDLGSSGRDLVTIWWSGRAGR
jgi:SAM-dependent methyltransferase